MKSSIFLISVIGFLICFVEIELYFIHKSIERFKELAGAYKKYKQAKTELEAILYDKNRR